MRRLLLDLDYYGGTDPFMKRTADVLTSRLVVVFRRLLCLGSFPVAGEWLITPIPKSPPSSSVTTMLFKVFERLVLVRIWQFWNA